MDKSCKKPKNEAVKPCCGNCFHSRPHPNKERVKCHRYPPQVITTIASNPLTGQVEPGAIAVFAEVPLDEWCAEWDLAGDKERKANGR